jgi:heme exporter protein A
LEALLEARQLGCRRDERTLFQNLTLALEAGDVLQIEGPNGSGKTTLLRALAGLISDYSGGVRWRGMAIGKTRENYFAELLYTGHHVGVKTRLTPQENLHWYCGLHGTVSQAAMDQALEAAGLYGYEDVACHSLSAGQQRRVALARLYLGFHQPLWILDEPYTALDRQGVADLDAVILSHVRQGGMVVLTTHHNLALRYPKLQRINLGAPGLPEQAP